MTTTEELVHALCEAAAENPCACLCEECDQKRCVTPLLRTAADLIEQQAAKIKELEANVPRWIPVTERRPEPEAYDYVLTCVTEKNTKIDYRNAVVMAFVSEEELVDVEIDRVLGGVTHWMPLPEAPKEENDG